MKKNSTAPAQASLVNPRIILPAMIFVGVLMIGFRVDDMWSTLLMGKSFHAIPPLQASSEKKAEATSHTEAKTEEHATPTAKTAPPPENKAVSKEQDSEEMVLDPMIVKQLMERREQLESRAQELDTRESLLKVTEQRVEQKIREMETLRGQLQGLVNTANAAQQTQLDNLVKVYETMKGKEAAKIFETLEMPTLLGVVERMKPARVAVIMAEMAPEKAKELTIALTRKDQLPPVK